MTRFLILVVLLSSLGAVASVPNNRHMVVEGQAQVAAAPDSAVVSFQVEVKKTESLDAKNEVDQRVNAFLAGINQFGVNEKNVSASSIVTSPSYHYNNQDQQVLDGYLASRVVKVTLSDISKLNALLNFALTVKLDAIQNIEFHSSRKAQLIDEAVAKAVADAKAKGRSMADAFEVKLGRVYSINSANQQQRFRFGFNDRVERIEVTGSRINAKAFEPGRYLQENIVFSAEVQVVFDLEVE